jgi:hypothetical protein
MARERPVASGTCEENERRAAQRSRLAERQRACREAMGEKWLGHPGRRLNKEESVKMSKPGPPVREAKK